MDLVLLSVVALVALALLFDFSNGFHDAANSISTVVATRAMSTRAAVLFAAACNFVAYFVVGNGVANTVAKVVEPGSDTVLITFAALVSAVSWNYLTWFFGLPSSSSHAIMGGLVGAGIAAGGLGVVNWEKVREVLLYIVLSPLAAFLVAIVGTALVEVLQRVFRWGDDGKPFKALQIASAAFVSFGHGANDAQKTMGVIGALLLGAGYTSATTDGTIAVPEWVALSAYSAIALGTAWGGWRIVETMGLKLTRLTAKSAVAANLGAVFAVFSATYREIPISTTHAAASSVVGAGVGARQGANWKVVGEMVVGWVVTIPATSVLAFLVFSASGLPGAAGAVAVGVISVVFVGAVGWATVNAFGASDLDQQLDAHDAGGEKPPAATDTPQPTPV